MGDPVASDKPSKKAKTNESCEPAGGGDLTLRPCSRLGVGSSAVLRHLRKPWCLLAAVRHLSSMVCTIVTEMHMQRSWITPAPHMKRKVATSSATFGVTQMMSHPMVGTLLMKLLLRTTSRSTLHARWHHQKEGGSWMDKAVCVHSRPG